MSKRNLSYRRLQKYSIGDMRERIKICIREITPGTDDNPQFTETYTEVFELWASITTPSKGFAGLSGIRYLSGVTVPEQTSHIFVIRYEPTVTNENRILFEGIYYKIVDITNPENRNEYMILFTQLLGDSSKNANQ